MMSKISGLYNIFCNCSKAWAYAKLCQKTGMTPPDIDVLLDVYKNSSKFFERQIKSCLERTRKTYKTNFSSNSLKNQLNIHNIKPEKHCSISDDTRIKIINPRLNSNLKNVLSI